MNPWLKERSEIPVASCFDALNGFPIAATFALVRLRRVRLDEVLLGRRPCAAIAKRPYARSDGLNGESDYDSTANSAGTPGSAG